MSLTYDYTNQLFKSHPGLRLLRAEHAPLILSFLNKIFIQPNIRSISQSDIVSRLEDLIFTLREVEGEELYPRNARNYIDEWTHNEKGWLRKFYPENSDEPHYDLTPATEKALTWIEDLAANREFIGTESRLRIIFELLRQMAMGTEKDAETRIAELERKKRELAGEIAMIRRGEIEVMDGTALRDRFMQFSSMARELLSDFRIVEHNFRKLDAEVREKIASWDGGKGDLLEQIFGERDTISGSDQGKSFQAFCDFLMSERSQEEFTALLEKIFSLEELKIFSEEKRLKRILSDWLDAGEHTQRTIAGLSGQLRRYLDNKAYLENKRIMKILDSITASALKVKDGIPQGIFMTVHDPAPNIKLPMERPLFRPSEHASLDTPLYAADCTEINYSSLFEQIYVDKSTLLANIRVELSEKSQVALHDLIRTYPLKKGLAELIAYITIASGDELAVFDDEQKVYVEWEGAQGVGKRVAIPFIIFNRRSHDGRI